MGGFSIMCMDRLPAYFPILTVSCTWVRKNLGIFLMLWEMTCRLYYIWYNDRLYEDGLKNVAVILSYIQIQNLAPDITLEEKEILISSWDTLSLNLIFQPSNDPYVSF